MGEGGVEEIPKTLRYTLLSNIFTNHPFLEQEVGRRGWGTEAGVGE